MKQNKYYIYVCIALLIGFFIQLIFGLRWEWLETIQTNESYKRWSGLFLTAYLANQWGLSFLRRTGRMRMAKRVYHLHSRLGALAPLFFYIHSIQWGYAYLFLLSVLYFVNIFVGILNQDFLYQILKKKMNRFIKRRRYIDYWAVTHISFSTLTVILLGYHIFIVFYYN